MMEAIAATRPDLPRTLGILDTTAIVIGIVIGSGIFLLPNLIARHLPSANAILAVWIVAGLLSLIGAFAYAELGAMLPATGGQYVYLRAAYGPCCAFVSGWTFMLAVLSGGSAWLAVTFSIYAGYFVPLTPALSKLLSVTLIAVLSAVNYVGVRESAWVQRTFTYLKVAALLVLIAAGLFAHRAAQFVIRTELEELRLAGDIALEDPEIPFGIDSDGGDSAVIRAVIVRMQDKGIGEGISHRLFPMHAAQGAAIGRTAMFRVANGGMDAEWHA